MMKLSTLWNIDRTVDAAGGSPIAERILEHWEHDRGSARFFRSSANFVYAFRNGGARFFLRFADSAERRREAIEAEVNLLRWLAGAGIAVAPPVRSRDGRFVETVATDAGLCHAVVFAGLAGAQRDLGELDGARLRAWGAALGKLHAALKAYPGAGAAARGDWRDQLALAGAWIPGDAPAVRQELDQIAASLAALPANAENHGLIHGDFELDNLYWHDRGIAILDFDDCARHWFVADIALALRDLFDGGVDLGDGSFRQFIRGYAERSPLDDELLSRLPLFLRMADLVGYARLVRATDLPAARAYPEWLTALSRKLQDRMAAYKAALERRDV